MADIGLEGKGQPQQEMEERKPAESHGEQRDAALEALRESEETARALLNAPTDTALIIDLQGTILAINEIAAGRLDKSVDELLGLCIYDLLSPELAKSRRAVADEVARSGLPIRFEDERADILFDNHVYPVFDAQGRVTRLAIFGRDITERVRTEEALRESESQSRALLNAIPDLFFRLSRDGTFLDFIPAKGLEPFRPPSEFLGEKVVEILPAEVAEPVMHRIEQTLETGDTQIFEYSLEVGDQPHHYEARFVPSGVQADEVLAIVRDITQRKEREAIVEEERQRIARELYDGLAHTLYLLGLRLEYPRKRSRRGPKKASGELHSAQEAVGTDDPGQNEPGQAPNTMPPLSALELTILRLVAQGLSNGDIGVELGMAAKTIGNRLTGVFNKLGVENRVQAALYALRHGLASLDEGND
jgi:PAS domain S-box-containing protein